MARGYSVGHTEYLAMAAPRAQAFPRLTNACQSLASGASDQGRARRGARTAVRPNSRGKRPGWGAQLISSLTRRSSAVSGRTLNAALTAFLSAAKKEERLGFLSSGSWDSVVGIRAGLIIVM